METPCVEGVLITNIYVYISMNTNITRSFNRENCNDASEDSCLESGVGIGVMCNKGSFIGSVYNIMHIKPRSVCSMMHTYHVGVYKRDEHGELVEVDRCESGIKLEDYFPMVIHNLNKRGNWRYIPYAPMDQESEGFRHAHVGTIPLDFAWSNMTTIDNEAQSHARFTLNSAKNYISNKRELYDKFATKPFIIPYTAFSTTTISQTLFTDYVGKRVIIKPDAGRAGMGILMQNVYDYEGIVAHLAEFPQYQDWTISEIVISKLCRGYIVTNRVYFLVVKRNNQVIDAYFYKQFMNYIPPKPFTGDVTDRDTFLTNFWDKCVSVKTMACSRFIPHNIWLNSFTACERKSIMQQVRHIFRTIACSIKDDLLAANDNRSGERVSFHVYGADLIVNDAGEVKLLELNGAPAMNDKPTFYRVPDRVDYFELFDELFQLTVDTVYPPGCDYIGGINRFKHIYHGCISHSQSRTYYICDSIVQKYPFIWAALDKRTYLKRTRNMHDDIDVFYGLRERYVTDDTNLNYYDEILNYRASKLMRSAGIINKVQGVTYYLANKGRLYQKLWKLLGRACTDFHPISFTFCYHDETRLRMELNDFLYKPMHSREIVGSMVIEASQAVATLRVGMHRRMTSVTIGEKVDEACVSVVSRMGDDVDTRCIRRWILKPVHGSMGMGICILDAGCDLVERIIEHVRRFYEEGIAHTYIKRHGFFMEPVEETVIKKYNYWILSQYLDRPHLLDGRKYNIRFYVVTVINGNLPTFGHLTEPIDTGDIVRLYMFRDCILYTCMLEYNNTEVPEMYAGLPECMIERMRNLTNLEIINDVYEAKPELSAYMSLEDMKDRHTHIMSQAVPPALYECIMRQGRDIIRNSIDAVKYDMRSLNRYAEDYKSCFNFLAYDMMLDADEKLWLIEVNRGPDINAMRLKYGETECIGFFDEMFGFAVDPFYTESGTGDIRLERFQQLPIEYEILNTDP